MKKMLICTAMLLSIGTMVQCTKQTTVEEREIEQAGSDIIRGDAAPLATQGKIGDYFINEKTAEFYGPKKSVEEGGWGSPVRFGKDKDGKTKIYSDTGAPSNTLGNEGDWYIDKESKKLYGPKTQNQWGNGIVLGGNPNNGSNQDSDASLPNYRLGDEDKTLLAWTNPKTQVIDMTKDHKLNQVTKLEIGAISEQRALQKFVLGQEVSIISASAFKNCFYMEEFVFNSKLTTIGQEAFRYCLYLETMEFPESLEVLEQGAFKSCVKLKKVVIPSSCKRIEGIVFEDCEVLDDVTLKEGVEVIYNNAFQGCKSLKKIVFPSTLKGLGAGIFKNGAISEVTFKGNVPEMSLGQGTGSPFEGLAPGVLEKIYVPQEFIEDYKAQFKDYAAIIQPLQK
ncbi:MAG: leucine-rich repeat domain-containing protein [Capnocytophaga sp.]|nr:leucine-rich repeat domain-containing protein [Capnocytophaga sp.]